ncbi:hypothetical protein Tco_0953160 [Tanacetum coccineum]|uniref:Uncharacterized protein n=1 Tax=Tanacetum coccineum TaxID=301880 RepID=A0ABQ5DZ33_9ASTR
MKNPVRTLGDYSRPSHEGYRNTIELPDGNNVVPLRSDTIQLVQNRCSFHELQSEDPNQHLKGKNKGLGTHDLEGYEFKTRGGRGGESFWEGGDDFGVDVLRFHTCLTDILGFLEKLEWWFEQDIDDEED